MEGSNANDYEAADELVTEVPAGMVCVDNSNYLLKEKRICSTMQHVHLQYCFPIH
jgi:hypothetical protein